jgi:two-component system sensor histidine kinase VicK
MNGPTEFTILTEIGDLSHEGLVLYDLADDKIIYANSPAMSLMGLGAGATFEEVKLLLGSIKQEDRELLEQQYHEVMHKSVSDEIEFRLRDDLQKTFICSRAYLLRDSSTLVIYIRDITRVKLHENYLIEFGTKKNTLLDTLTHHISGALNLMRHLTGEAEKYIDESADKNLKIYLRLVSENSEACLKIIEDFLEYEHEKSATISIKLSRINLVEKINYVREELEHSYSRRKFYLHSPSKEIYISTDDIKLLQIVNNLISNAIKFSNAKDTVTIQIADFAREVIVAVADKGVGIPEELKPFIFQRRPLGGRPGLHGEPSKGLGLSICKKLIELLGGRIWFESTVGVGSTFYISLPKS